MERSAFLQYIIVFSPLPGRPLAMGSFVQGDLTLTPKQQGTPESAYLSGVLPFCEAMEYIANL